MLIFMIRYVFLSWFLFGGSISERLLMCETDIIDKDLYRVAACTASCMQQQRQQQQHNSTHFKNCYEHCKNANATANRVRQIHENYSMTLVCRDDRSLTFRIELEGTNSIRTTAATTIPTTSTATVVKLHAKRHVKDKQRNVNSREINTSAAITTLSTATTTRATKTMQINISPEAVKATATTLQYTDTGQTPETVTTAMLRTTVFIVKVHSSEAIMMYMSNDSFITIANLQHNSSYSITTWAVHATNEYSVIAKAQQFTTLRRGYTPGIVRDIHVKRFMADESNDMRLQALITWRPSADMTCHYNLICFAQTDQGFDMPPMEMRNPRQLYTYTLENLTFAADYMVGIRAKNSNNISKESELAWASIRTPSCAEWYNFNFNICPPLKPDGLDVKRLLVSENTNSLNITWNKPEHQPSYYTVRVLDIMEGGNTYAYNISKELNALFVPELELLGVLYEVHLTAYTPGGNATASFTQINTQMVLLPDKSHHIVKLIAAILAPIFCAVILSLTIFIICHRRAKLKRYQERCKYFEELEKKAPIDPKANFDFPTKSLPLLTSPEDLAQFQLDLEEKVFFNDAMEIDRRDVTLHEVLGEGAFGLVRRGFYNDVKLGAREVAVKMLKDHPSIDDVRAFRREIEVMKSVEKHPNIVGIIGHCTKHYTEMLLLTEYCSFGNLLDFLRDEWKYLFELNVKCNKILLQQQNQQQQQCNRTLPQNTSNNKSLKNFYNSSNSNSTSNQRSNNMQAAAAEGVFNIEANLIERLKFKYKNLNAFAQKHNNVNIAESATILANNDAAAPPPTPANSPSPLAKPKTIAADNKSYGYAEICHAAACKCQTTEVVASKDTLDAEDNDTTSSSLLQTQQQRVEVKHCLCQQHARFEQSSNNKTQKQNDKQSYVDVDFDVDVDVDIDVDANTGGVSHAITNQSYLKYLPDMMSEAALRQRQWQRRQARVAAHNVETALNDSENNSSNDSNSNNKLITNSTVDACDSALSECVRRVPLSAADLLDIAKQVAVGMEFLAKNKVVHRDLAARNVLVAPDRTIKIADFGLSRDVYQENVYKKTGNGKLPIKWLALESMTHQVYTTQSDVWSYGILLYEIVTLGGTPYPSISTNRLLHLLKTGYRMEKPKNCGNEFYNLMRGCWNVNPAERPNFGEIIKLLDSFLYDVPEKQILSVLSVTQRKTMRNTLPGIEADEERHSRSQAQCQPQPQPLLQTDMQSPMEQHINIEDTLNNDDSYLKPL